MTESERKLIQEARNFINGSKGYTLFPPAIEHMRDLTDALEKVIDERDANRRSQQ
jgi:hypothetical protein